MADPQTGALASQSRLSEVSPWLRRGIRVAALGATIFALTWLATRYGAQSSGGVTLIWPVNAVMLVFLVRSPLREWPALLIVASLCNFAAGRSPLTDFIAASELTVCDTFESVVGALALLRLVGPDIDLSRRSHLLAFGAVAVLASAASSIPASLVLLATHGVAILRTLPLWILGDTLGFLIVAPALLAARSGELEALFSPPARLRTALVLGCELAVIAAVCWTDLPGLRALILAAFILPALELGMSGAALGVLLGATIELSIAIVRATGSHAAPDLLAQNAIALQVFLAVNVAVTLGLAVTLARRKSAELALAASEARYRLIADRVSDVILRYDLAGNIEFISPSVRSLVGFEPAEVIGHNVVDFLAPGERMRGLEIIARGGSPPTDAQNELRVRRRDGQQIWIQGNPSPIYDASGAVTGMISVVRDITERRAIEDELRRKRAEAEAAVRAKSQFLANMSHEIRTPLTAIIGFAGLLDRLEGLPDRARAYVSRIATGGEALQSLVNDILDFTRLEANQVEIVGQSVDPRQFLESTVGLMRPEAARKGLRLDCVLGGAMPPLVRFDTDRARQTLLNLLSNAIKFTASGGVTVEAHYLPDHGGNLRIAVIDTGVGIAPEDQGRLFQRFSQIDDSNTRNYGGAGLGLAICKGLVELLGGEIGVDSAKGQGSTFWFTLAAPLADDQPPIAPEPAEPAEHPRLHGLRLLVVEDDPINRELITSILTPFGPRIETAADGDEAIRTAAESRFDLILLDLQMPRLDGLAAARSIRAGAACNRNTPILALSANVLPQHVEACRLAGMNDHIGKPIKVDELLRKIDQWAAPSEAVGA